MPVSPAMSFLAERGLREADLRNAGLGYAGGADPFACDDCGPGGQGGLGSVTARNVEGGGAKTISNQVIAALKGRGISAAKNADIMAVLELAVPGSDNFEENLTRIVAEGAKLKAMGLATEDDPHAIQTAVSNLKVAAQKQRDAAAQGAKTKNLIGLAIAAAIIVAGYNAMAKPKKRRQKKGR